MDKNCAVFYTANLVGKRWTLLILLELYKGPNKWKRYHELKSRLPQLTPKILSMRLKELEADGIIAKNVDSSTVPIKSEYSLTKKGDDFIKVIQGIKEWTMRWAGTGTYKHCKGNECKQCGW